MTRKGYSMDKGMGRCFKKNNNIVSRLIDEETILVPIKQKAGEIECIYTLNDTGACIWQLIDGKLTVGGIADKVVEKYSVSKEKALADLNDLIKDLEEANCIEKAS